ncbi:competence/damage-inducible protein A [Sungkyunkwania multivorans]|uniref:CinA-like protein n=1 Tax=Sungkyunkwania multivorans TaxID=1173618 RepID=A0ABW3D3V2_9FLAO
MKAEIITIGDEILIGQIVDTNSVFISKALNKIGIEVYQITSVQDDHEHILQAFEDAEKRVDVVLITGGLGPTKDDITKHTIASYFNDTLVQNDQVLAHIEHLFKKYIKTPISDINRQQALVPSKADALMNRFGTAPGMWLENKGTVFVSMPGVPYEMKALMANEVLPRLQEKFERPYILHKTVLTYGLGESAIAAIIEEWQDNLPSFIKLAYLPNLGRVRLRLSAKGKDKLAIEKEVDRQIQMLYPLIGDLIYGMENDDPIEAILGQQLKKKKQTLAVAESCTGGKIAEMITSIPGASAYFKGGVVTYATESKEQVLDVPSETIAKHSVVSAEVAISMAVNAQQLFKTDYAIATTGNAGPTKGDADAEVGTVFIGVATPTKVFAEEFKFGNHREKVVNKAANKAFELLQKEILKN